MPDRIIISFLCPNCGAEVETIEGYTNVECKYCGSRLLITQRLGMPRVFSRPTIKKPRSIIKSSAGKNAKIVDLDLLFIPLIKIRAEIIGWIYAYKKGEVKKDYYNSTPGGTQLDSQFSEPYIVGEKTVKKRIRRILAEEIDPSDFYRFGIKKIKIEGKKFEPYNDSLLHQFGNVFDLPLSVDEYLDQGGDLLISKVTSYYHGWDELKYILKAIKKETTIYYYPVYFSRLEVDGAPYSCSVDAVSGEILLKEGMVKKEGKRTIKLNPLYGIISFAAVAVSVVYSFIGKIGTLIICLALLFLIWELQYGTD